MRSQALIAHLKEKYPDLDVDKMLELIDGEFDSITVGYLEDEKKQNLELPLRCDLNTMVMFSVIDKYIKEKK